MCFRQIISPFLTVLLLPMLLLAQPDYRLNNPELDRYFERQVRIAQKKTAADLSSDLWTENVSTYREELRDMLGLKPWPDRSPLNLRISKTTKYQDIVVESLVFESLPNLYVTASLYRPAEIDLPLPAVIYVCGHSAVKIEDVSYGSKAQYQHHAIWFARNGYVCLILDTLQLGEIEGLHHGLYREGMWWWINKGYTPAGIEAWNGIRAIDLLQSREDVDPTRIGITGRSGGGATSWWVAALDERIQVAVPVAGITDLQNHVVDGVVEGHCDCMYMLNKYSWDFAKLAALVAPRPLEISNSDQDSIFPLDGVMRVYWSVRDVYKALGAEDRLALAIGDGPHRDTQQLRIPAFKWFNKWLRDETEPSIEDWIEKALQPEQLRVFSQIPPAEINTRIHEFFPIGSPKERNVEDSPDWLSFRLSLLKAIESKCFRGWPTDLTAPAISKSETISLPDGTLETYEFLSEPEVSLGLWLFLPRALNPTAPVLLHVPTGGEWESATGSSKIHDTQEGGRTQTIVSSLLSKVKEDLDSSVPAGPIAIVVPRGLGLDRWNPEDETHIRRRFLLVGQTDDGMRVWDIRRAIQGLQQIKSTSGRTVTIQSAGVMGIIAAYAALYQPQVSRIHLVNPSASHRDGPYFIDIDRVVSLQQALALLLPDTEILLAVEDPEEWDRFTNFAEQSGSDAFTVLPSR